MIRLKNVSKIYNKGKANQVVAVNNVNLTIADGELLGIMGPSGCGKSSLLHILGCMTDFDGSYMLDEIPIKNQCQNTLAEIRNRKIGYVLQEYALLPQLSVKENIEIPLLFGGAPRDKITFQCLEVLRYLHIEHLYRKKVCELSGGQKQRVAIARAIVNQPDIILADEPTGALDSKTAHEIIDILVDLSRTGRTVIIVTHDITVANRCDRVLHMIDGRIID